jgi:triacylglycerol lipase
MRWLTSNLLFLCIFGSLFVLGSFVRFRFVWPERRLLATGIVFWLLTAAGVARVLLGPPGPVDTIEVPPGDRRPPAPAATALERLRLKWDSEADANWPAAASLAELSEIAYEPPHLAEKGFQALGFDKVMPVVKGSMIGYVVSGENVSVVVFRGTDFEEVSDWLANLERSSIDTEHGPVHKGFYNAYQSMKQQVDAILAERDATHMWITGHSLGGALALMCAYDLMQVEQRKLNGVMTYGQPFVAHEEFAAHINSILVHRYARFVNGADLVARVPPSHVPCGSLVWFTDSGLRRSFIGPLPGAAARAPIPTPTGETPKRAEIEPLTEAEFDALQQALRLENAAKERLPAGAPIKHQAASPFVDDHSMFLYRERIHALLGLAKTP